MCGIVAIVDPAGRVSPHLVQRAAEVLHHRGPDPQRNWVARAPARRTRPRAAQHHRPHDGRSADRERGRAAAHRRERRVLRFRARSAASSSGEGHRFRTRSDSEIALHLYEDLGARCLHQLRGEFAFALWDERDSTLVRGARPLRHQAALLRGPATAQSTRVRDQGARRRSASRCAGIAAIALRLALRRITRRIARSSRVSTRFRPATTCSPTASTCACCRIGTSTTRPRRTLRGPYDPTRAHRAFRGRVRGGRTPAPARRCARRVLPERRHRLVRRARRRLEAFSAADSRVHALLRSGGLRRARDRARSRRARPARTSSRSTSARATWPITSPMRLYFAERPFINAHCVAKYLLSRAVRDSGVQASC